MAGFLFDLDSNRLLFELYFSQLETSHMKNFLGSVLLLAISLSSLSSLYAQGPDEYWIGLEEYAVHTEGDLAGMTTWRMYLHLLDEDDFLSACTGSDVNPFILESTTTPAWYQHPSASETFATGINSAFFTAFPDLEYDSWFTIGVSPNIIEASFKALIDSLDYKLYKEKAPANN